MRRDDATLFDIVMAARKALAFTQGFDRDSFRKDEKTQAAVLHEITIIGEAVKRLSEEFRNGHPEVPWKEIAGTRDWLVHHSCPAV